MKSAQFETLKQRWIEGRITEAMLQKYVLAGRITEAELQEILSSKEEG